MDFEYNAKKDKGYYRINGTTPRERGATYNIVLNGAGSAMV
jgi:hypothetical protein